VNLPLLWEETEEGLLMAANATKTLYVRYVKSAIGYPERQKRTVRALGLKRLGDRVEVPATEATLGMIDRISHLVEVVEPEDK
jgi:large subunit ribosomal protein L30